MLSPGPDFGPAVVDAVASGDAIAVRSTLPAGSTLEEGGYDAAPGEIDGGCLVLTTNRIEKPTAESKAASPAHRLRAEAVVASTARDGASGAALGSLSVKLESTLSAPSRVSSVPDDSPPRASAERTRPERPLLTSRRERPDTAS